MRPARWWSCALAAAAAACSPRAPAPLRGSPRPAAGEVVAAYPEEPASLNPYVYAGATRAARDLLRPVLPTLLSITPSLAYAGGAALAVPGRKDIGQAPFSVTFHLDPRARWSDGVPITAQDVVFTWTTISDKRWPVADRSGYSHLADVEALGADTVKITFQGAYPAWRDLFSAGSFILPRHLLEGKAFDAAFGDEGPAISGGPFRIEKRIEGLEIDYVPNPMWWGSGPRLARVRVQFVPDIETAIQLLEAGRVDVVCASTTVNLGARLRALANVSVTDRLGADWWELAFQTKRPAVSSPALREGVAESLDRAGFDEAVVRGDGRPLQSLHPAVPSQAFAQYGFDPARAAASFAQAGYQKSGDGSLTKPGTGKLSLVAPEDSEIADLLIRALQAGLKPAGLGLDVRTIPARTFYSELPQRGDFDLALWERRGSPSPNLDASYRSGLDPPAGANYDRLSSPLVDAALDEAGPSSGEHAMEALADALPALPLFEARSYLAYRRGITGPEANASVDGPFWNLQDWARSR